MTMTTNERGPQHRPFEEFVSDETVEHLKAARQQFRQGFEAMFPPGFVEHRRAARKEMLLAVRSLIDSAIERMEPPSTSGKARNASQISKSEPTCSQTRAVGQSPHSIRATKPRVSRRRSIKSNMNVTLA